MSRKLFAQVRLPLLFLGRRDGDRLAKPAIDEPLDAHLRVRTQEGVARRRRRCACGCARRRSRRESPERLLHLPRLPLQADHGVLARLERREHVEVGASRPVHRDEVFGGEHRSDHAPQRARRVLEQAVEDLPAVRVLDVAVLLDVDVEHAHLAVVEQAVAQRIDDHGHRRQLRHRVEEEVLEADLLVVGAEERRGRRPLLFEEALDRGEEFLPRERLGDVVVRPDLHAGDQVADLALDREHRDRDVAGFRSALERRADFPARELGHHDVEQDEVRVVLDRLLDALAPVARRGRRCTRRCRGSFGR